MNETKHTAVIYGKKVRKIYKAYATSMGWGVREMHDEPKEDTVFIEIVKIGEYELSNPPIEKSTVIFLHELNASAKVESVQRSTEDKWVCKTDHIVDIIEDEETQRTYEKALEFIEKYRADLEKYRAEAEAEAERINKPKIEAKLTSEPEPRSEPKDFTINESKKRWWQIWK